MALNSLGLGMLFQAKDMASGVMDKVKHSLEGVSESAGISKVVLKDAFGQFGTGVGLMGAGALGLNALRSATEESTKLGKAIALVATESDEATFPQTKMRDITQQLGVQFAKLPTEEAAAMYKAVALGANDAAKSTAFLNGVNLLAVAGDSDLITTTNALGGTLNAYGAGFDQATSYGESFFTAMKMGNTTIQELASSVGRVAPTAHALNIPFDELIGSVSVMTNKGIAAAEAVSGIKEALANIIHPSADAQKEAKRLGIDFSQGALRAKGSMQEFLAEIMKSPKFTQESFSKLFTSVEGAGAVINVTSNNMKDFGNVLEAMKHKSGATQKGFDIMANTMEFQQKQFEASKASALSMIGGALEPMGVSFLKLANIILMVFTKIPKPVIGFFTRLFAGVSTVLLITGSILALKAGITIAGIAMEAFGFSLGAMLAPALPIIAALGLLMLAFYGAREAYDRNFGGFADAFDKVFEKVWLIVKGIGQAFGDGGFSGEVREGLNQAENSGLKTFVIKLFVWGKRIEHFFDMFADGFSSVMQVAGPILTILVDQLSGLFATIFGATNDINANKDAWSAWGDAGYDAGQVIGSVVSVIAAVIDISITTWRVLASVVMGVFGAIGSSASGFVDVFYGLTEFVVSLLTGDWAGAWHGMKTIAFGVIDAIIGMVMSLVGSIAGAVDAIGGMFGHKTEWQKQAAAMKDDLHNSLAKDMGVADATGLRGATPVTTLPRTSTSVAGAAAGPTTAPWAPGDLRPGIDQTNQHLATIAQQGKRPMIFNMMLDENLKAKIVGDGSRGFEPGRTPA